MRRLTASLCLLLLFCNFGASQPTVVIYLPQHERVYNPGRCCYYCCMETVGRHFQMSSLYNLVARLQTWGTPIGTRDEVQAWADYLGVRVVKNPFVTLDKSLQWVQEQVQAGRPVIVATARWRTWDTSCVPPRPIDHAILITRFSGDLVYYMDPDDCRDYYLETKDFCRHWYGYADVILPK